MREEKKQLRKKGKFVSAKKIVLKIEEKKKKKKNAFEGKRKVCFLTYRYQLNLSQQ